MIRALIALSLVVLQCSFAPAQSPPRFELFGGYVYTRTGGVLGTTNPAKNLNGWELSGTANITSWFSVEGSVAGVYGSAHEVRTVPTSYSSDTFTVDTNAHVYTFLGGPRVELPHGRVTPFAHVLAGAATVRQPAGGTYSFLVTPGPHVFGDYRQTAFAFTAGGGVNVRLTDRLSIRAIQLDYLRTQLDEPTGTTGQNGVRMATGLVFTFGST